MCADESFERVGRERLGIEQSRRPDQACGDTAEPRFDLLGRQRRHTKQGEQGNARRCFSRRDILGRGDLQRWMKEPLHA